MISIFQGAVVSFFVVVGLFDFYLAGKYKGGYKSENSAKDAKYYVITAIILLVIAFGIWQGW